MKKYIRNPGIEDIEIRDIGKIIVAGETEELDTRNIDFYIESEDAIEKIRSGELETGNGTTFWSGPEGELFLKDKFSNLSLVLDGTTILEFTPEVMEDTPTGKKGVTLFMDLLALMKELYNEPSNPLYEENFQKFVGSGGREQEHLNRTNNIEVIHGKTGWHRREIEEAKYLKPADLLFYYGWLNSFNYPDNSWNNQKVARDMAKYYMIVLGDGIQDPSHGDYSNTQTIINRIKQINPKTLIFGYVTVNQSQGNFETKATQWNTLGVHGIFMDECGYDYGITRETFNTRVDYVHNLSSANTCFVNAWNMDHIIGTANDPSYPNSTYNPNLLASNLDADDWYLLESFSVNTSSYVPTDGYEPKDQWSSRGFKAIGHRDTYGINLAGVGIINNDNSKGQELFAFSFTSACMFALDAYGTSDTSYGASSAIVNYWDRPSVSEMGNIWSPATSVQQDVEDANKFWRFTEFGSFSVDFSDNAQESKIVAEKAPLSFYLQASDGETYTTSKQWQEKLSLEFTPPTKGAYQVSYTALLSCTDPNVLIKARIQIDDSATKGQVATELPGTYNYSDGVYIPYSGSFLVELGPIDHFIDMDFCSGVNGVAAYIKEAVVIVRRLN